MSPVVVRDDLLPSATVTALRDGALQSPFLGESTLSGGFLATRGFSITWRSGAREDVLARVPFLRPFLDVAMDAEHVWAVTRRIPLLPRALFYSPPNAFYLNFLMVPCGEGVDRHVDATLSPKAHPDALIPAAVAVLYVDVPAGMRGGELLLDDPARDGAAVGEVDPKPGRFVWFAGRLAHSVKPVVHDDANAVRMSWVLEQYVLDAEALAQVPTLKVHSRQGFDAFLADARARQANAGPPLPAREE